jgi:hypothetical protein
MNFFNHCFPVDKYDIVEYSLIKATMESVRLRFSLFALTNTNSEDVLFGHPKDLYVMGTGS